MSRDSENKEHGGEPIAFGPDARPWEQSVPDVALSGGSLKVTPPSQDPCAVYPKVPGITCKDFQLPPAGLSPEQHAQALSQMAAYHDRQEKRFLGYQANQNFDYERLKRYLTVQINNIGDPFQGGNFTLNSKWVERAVMDYYASLWNAKWPHDPGAPGREPDPETYWGYVLSMGSTEGNLYALWNAREYLSGQIMMLDPGAQEQARKASLDGKPRGAQPRWRLHQPSAPQDNPNAYLPVAFYSEDSHYSVTKAMRLTGFQTFSDLGKTKYPKENPLAPGQGWPDHVPSTNGGGGPGTIDIAALQKLVTFFASKGHPIFVFFNYGTTFKGAYDDVERAGEALIPILKQYGLYERDVCYTVGGKTHCVRRNGFWFHVDGALGAAYMPFLEMARASGRFDKDPGPRFDFRLPFVHSISMSGHKWVGAPWPCGIYMTKRKYQMRPPSSPGYLGSQDTTFAGSRNGFSAMLLWDYLARNSYDNQIDKAVRGQRVAERAHQKLLALQQERKEDLWVDRTPLSLTLRFKQAKPSIIFDYSLSSETLYVNGQQRKYSHIFIMDHVDDALIDSLIAALRAPDAFPAQDKPAEPRLAALAAEAAPEPQFLVPEELVDIEEPGSGFR